MRSLSLVVFCLLVAAPLAAQEPQRWNSHEQAALELMEVTRMQEMTLSSADVMLDAMVANNPLFASMRDIVQAFFTEFYRWDELEPQYVRLYTTAYSEPELRELIAFYRTPVGAKTVEHMPQIMRQASEIGQRQVAPHLPELQRRIMRRLEGGAQ